mgnify:FL=1|tara:strand:- start:755 stop:2206 length:1452 start_codon:yes stop_codon:yes gene_type:complete
MMLLCIAATDVFATEFNFKLKNQEGERVEVYAEVYKDNILQRRDFLAEVANEMPIRISLKSNEKLVFTGSSIDDKKEIVKREYNYGSLNKNQERTVDLRLLHPEKISGDILKFPELLVKLQNDRLYKLLTDTTKYKLDEFPDLGSFILYNTESQEASTYSLGITLANTEEINIVDIDDKNWVRSDLDIALGVGGIPAFGEVKTKFGTDQLIEFHTVVSRFKQKKLTGASLKPYDYIQQANFYDFMKRIFSSENGSHYKLFFVSSYLEADSIIFTGRSLKKLEAGIQVGTGTEAVVDISLNLQYVRDKGFSQLDKKTNVKFDYLVVDMTPFIAYKANQANQDFILKKNREQLANIKTTTVNFYQNLIQVDTEINGFTIFPEAEDVLTITDAVVDEINLKPKTYMLDSVGNILVDPDISRYNRLVSAYNRNLSKIQKRLDEYYAKEKEIIKLEEASNGLIPESDFMVTNSIKLDDTIVENITRLN